MRRASYPVSTVADTLCFLRSGVMRGTLLMTQFSALIAQTMALLKSLVWTSPKSNRRSRSCLGCLSANYRLHLTHMLQCGVDPVTCQPLSERG